MSMSDVLVDTNESNSANIQYYSQDELAEYYLGIASQILGRTEDVLLDRLFTIDEALHLIMELFYEHCDTDWQSTSAAIILHTTGYENTYFSMFHGCEATKFNPFTHEFE